MTTASEFAAKIVQGDADLDRLHSAVNDAPGTFTTDEGVSVRNLRGRLDDIGYKVPVAFTSGLEPQDGSFTVIYNGERYAADPGSTPFTTTGTFNAAQWLSLSTPSDLITYNQGGAGATDTTVKAKLQEFVSVKDFGAVGDGVTDDTAAIQAAIDAVANVDGDLEAAGVYLPIGTYRVTAQINVTGAKLFGEGIKSVILQDGDFTVLFSDETCHLEGFILNGQWNGTDPATGNPTILHKKGTGTYGAWTGQVHYKDVFVKNSRDTGISVNGCGYSTLYNVTVRGAAANGLDLIGDQATLAAITSTTIYNFNGGSIGGYAINLRDGFAINFNGCVWELCDGVNITGSNNRSISFTGCYSEAISSGSMPINFTSAGGLGLHVTGCYLASAPSGTTQSFDGTGFKRIFVASSTGEGGGRYDDDNPFVFNRASSNGSIIEVKRNEVTQFDIRAESGISTLQTYPTNSQWRIRFNDSADVERGIELVEDSGVPVLRPAQDNIMDLGAAARRFDDIYATNATIQTSDRNDKQDIAALSDAEQRVAAACKGLLRKFRWKDAVLEKGSEARIHFGVIAQDLQSAFEAEGLNAEEYGLLISNTWVDEETGEEHSRMGVRYSELLAFIIAAM